MEDKYQLIIVVVLAVLVLQFLLTRYYVSSTVEQTVDSIMDEKVKKINKRLMRSMNYSFEKYMGPTNDSRYEHTEPTGYTGPRHSHVYSSVHGYTEQDPRYNTRHNIINDYKTDRQNDHDVEGDRKRSAPNNDEDSIDDPAENDEEDANTKDNESFE